MSRLDDAIGSAFDSYDSDKSGYIEATEFQKLCSSLGAELADYEVERAISLIDTDGDKKINKAEFINWWENRGEDLDGDGKISEVEKKLSKVQHSGFEKAITFMLNSLHEDHQAVNREVTTLEERKAGIQKMLDNYTNELLGKNKVLAQLYSEKEKCDHVINEVEGAFLSIMEASQSLLHTTKNLGSKLDNRFPTREIVNDDTLDRIKMDHYERSKVSPSTSSFAYGGGSSSSSLMTPPLPTASSTTSSEMLSMTPEERALHESGFTPSPSRKGR